MSFTVTELQERLVDVDKLRLFIVLFSGLIDLLIENVRI